MGGLSARQPVKLISSLIFKDEEKLSRAEKSLVKIFGPVENDSTVFPFTYTDYYTKEFGPDLKRKIMTFRRLIMPDKAAEHKILTNKIEDKLRVNGKRTVNIDPGYITEAKLVLLTTKDYTHRIYVGKRIFAEVTLYYQDGSFRAWPWTYPDYASRELIAHFNGVRDGYLKEMRGVRGL